MLSTSSSAANGSGKTGDLLGKELAVLIACGLAFPFVCAACSFHNGSFPSLCEICDEPNPTYKTALAARALQKEETVQLGDPANLSSNLDGARDAIATVRDSGGGLLILTGAGMT